MAQHSSPHVLIEDAFDKPVVATFDSEHRTSDGGASLLGLLDARLGVTATIADLLSDPRDPARVEHSWLELFRQRVFSIALGYPDCNDSAHIAGDAMLKLVCGRGATGRRLASQPTLSRFESSLTGRDVVALGRGLEQLAIARLHKRHPKARLVTIDLDGSVDPTHGQQPFAYFNGHYDTWCYFPLLGFLSVEGDPEQYLFHARLRPGIAKESRGTLALLKRTVESLRSTFRKARIRVRLDAGFASPQLFVLLDELGIEYIVGMAGNSVLDSKAALHMHAARYMTDRFGLTTTFFGDAIYRARSWKQERRAVFKAEVVAAAGKKPRDNARFLITNLELPAEAVWRIYCLRGDSENRIKELKRDLEIDRTSCTSYLANQTRVLLTATAYMLYQELRSVLRGTSLARAMVSTLRLRLMKIGATVKESVRRVVISMPASHAWKDLWRLAVGRASALA